MRRILPLALVGAVLTAGLAAGQTNPTIVSKVNQNTKDFTRLNVSCASGMQLTGGGAEALGNASILNGSFPSSATTWSAVGHQPGVGNLGLSSYGICAKGGALHTVTHANNNPKHSTRVTIPCPAAQNALRGRADALLSPGVLHALV